jgi:hypothetical protein
MEIPHDGEFHHFQLVNGQGEIPLSISVLIHYNQPTLDQKQAIPPLNADDVLELHSALSSFDGNYTQAFKQSK